MACTPLQLTRPLRSLFIMFQARGSTAKWAGKKGWVYLLMVDTIMKKHPPRYFETQGLRAAAEAHPHL